MERPTVTRLFLRLFVASVAVNAVLGIWALLVGEFGETQGKVLATSFLVSASMLAVLVNAPAIGRRALWPIPVVGAAAAVIGFAQAIVMMWAEAENEYWFKTVGSFLVVAGGATLAANLSLVRLPDRYRPARPATYALITALAITILIAIWNEGGADWFGRLIGVLGVLVAAGSLLIPALARFSPGDDADGNEADPPDLHRCPACGHPIDLTAFS